MRKVISEDAIKGFSNLKIEEGKIYGEFQIGKQTKMFHKKLHHLATIKVLELLHVDLMGHMQVESLGRKKYVFVCVWMISQGILGSNSLEKNQTLLMFSKNYANESKEKKGSGILRIRSDHGK